MRVICLSSWFFDYTVQLANSLSKKETVCLMLPNNKWINEYRDTIDENIELYLFKEWGGSPANLLDVYHIIKQINSFKPDVIHIQFSHFICLFLLPFIRKYPIITTFHDPKPHLGEKKMLRTKFIMYLARKRSDQIIVHGERLKEIVMREYNISSNKVQVIQIGEHDVAPYKKWERKDARYENGNLILFFGRMRKYKGLQYLIKAEPLITKEVKKAKIIIAGEGDDFKEYEKMMINKDKFIVKNYYISYEEGAELFQRCSVVALPYTEASQSGIVPLAYGFKKPVVVTDVGSIPEIVDDGVTGFIVPPKNPEALADVIVKLLKHEKLRKQMGENAYTKLKTDLSWDNIVEKTLDVYNKAINDFKKGR